ncbi:PhoH family protein [Ectothiorhodospiraceae bacterium WFHF3C12]|nr:PhoH family protein [Ectothiorhodospiraceae bacterium WFHF3C12]
MAESVRDGRRLFVLDTSVLMHDPTALFRFQEHDLFLPMAVLRELDRTKTGLSEEARNVRQASRFLDELLRGADPASLERGLPLSTRWAEASGRLFFATGPGRRQSDAIDEDDPILRTALELRHRHPDNPLTVVSKDITRRIRAVVLGLHAEDYASDQALEDVDLLHIGYHVLPESALADVAADEEGRLWSPSLDAAGLTPNDCLAPADGAVQYRVEAISDEGVRLSPLVDYREPAHTVWGVNARNLEQSFALNLLLDPQIDFVSLLGVAGTGKTLLTLAAALAQTLDDRRYAEIIMTRATVAIGDDIGYLPGSEEEKMTPWMGALMDNLEVLTQPGSDSQWGRAVTNDLINSRIRIRSLNFMRGRTFLNRFIILDEAQNLTAKQIKTLITRAGPGTKLVCLGNVSQIDTPYLTATTSGLTYVVDRFKHWPHGGHITLQRGERSRLADFASESL